jgi:septal ring factor EnvC (AmiA/AmiB activator)
VSDAKRFPHPDENNKVQKAVLAESKAKLASTYSRITEVTKEIETTHNKVKADVDEGSRLLKEIREMKLELARLAVSNPPETVRPPLPASQSIF